MNLPAFTIHLQSGAVLAANAAGLQLLGAADRDAVVGSPVIGLLLGPALQCPSTGSAWLALPDGTRRYLDWMFVERPDATGEASLILRPGDEGALHARLCECLTLAVEDLLQSTPPVAVLRRIADALRRILDLRCVRVLELRGTALQLLHSRGDEACAAAARSEPLSPETTDEAGPALRCLRSGQPVEQAVEAAPAWKAALLERDIGSILAWPLTVCGSRCVIELYGNGAGDLVDPVLSGLLRKWLPWFETRQKACGFDPEQRLAAEALMEAATPALITDTDGAIVWINRAFTEVYGHSERDAIGATPRLIKSGSHGQRYYQALWASLRSGTPWAGETVDRAADGREVVVQQTITPVRHGGHITHFLSIHADITGAAELRAIRERERGIDELSGLMTRSMFEERGRQLLATAAAQRHGVVLLLCAVVGRGGRPPELDAATLAHVQGVLGRRLREVVDSGTTGGGLGPFDYAFLFGPPTDRVDEAARAIREAVAEPLPLLGASLGLVCHCAVAAFPQDGGSMAALYLAADKRLADLQADASTGP